MHDTDFVQTCISTVLENRKSPNNQPRAMEEVRIAFAGKVSHFFAFFFCLRLGLGRWVFAVVSPPFSGAS